MKNGISKPDRIYKVAWIILAVAVFVLILGIRIRLLGIPLSRDEGEYAYAGQLMLQGVPPYKLAYNMKFPGTYAAYAMIMSIFGQTVTGIHVGLLLINAATITLIFFLGRRLLNWTAGLAAAASYAVLSVAPAVLGFAGHAEHFVMLPTLGGALLLFNQSDQQGFRRLFASGLLFGLGLLMKQPAGFFVLFGAIYLVSKDVHCGFKLNRILLRSSIFGAGVILPLGITCLLLWYAGVFDKFWFWTVKYASQYGSLVIGAVYYGKLSLSRVVELFVHSIREVIGIGWMLWALALAGLGLLVGPWDKGSRTRTGFLLGLFVFSALAVCLGFRFSSHYFILVLPAVSLLGGVAVSRASDLVASQTRVVRFVPLVLFGAALSFLIFSEIKFFFGVSPVQACRMIYSGALFPESIRIAQYVRNHTSPDDTIAVLGSEPQIYFYSHRHSATGYIYTYGLMEPQKYAQQMQQEMIHEIELARPKYFISVVTKSSWGRRRESDPIFTWANEYTAENYAAIGLVNMETADSTYSYFREVPKSVPQGGDYILIYERKS